MPNFPALVSMTEVISAEVCLCNHAEFGFQQRFACATMLNLVYYSTFEAK